MGNYLNVGNDGFAAMVKDGYVDKTGMISFINGTLGTAKKLTCDVIYLDITWFVSSTNNREDIVRFIQEKVNP